MGCDDARQAVHLALTRWPRCQSLCHSCCCLAAARGPGTTCRVGWGRVGAQSGLACWDPTPCCSKPTAALGIRSSWAGVAWAGVPPNNCLSWLRRSPHKQALECHPPGADILCDGHSQPRQLPCKAKVAELEAAHAARGGSGCRSAGGRRSRSGGLFAGGASEQRTRASFGRRAGLCCPQAAVCCAAHKQSSCALACSRCWGRRAEAPPGAGSHPVTRSGREGRAGAGSPSASQAKYEGGALTADQEVLGFNVSMHHLVRVAPLHRPHQLVDVLAHLRGRVRACVRAGRLRGRGCAGAGAAWRQCKARRRQQQA